MRGGVMTKAKKKPAKRKVIRLDNEQRRAERACSDDRGLSAQAVRERCEAVARTWLEPERGE